MPLTRPKFFERAAEITAVLFSLAYTLLYLRETYQAAFIAAIIGSSIFTALCWKKKIYAESALHVFYVGMAVFGLLEWGKAFEPLNASFATHAPWLLAGAAATTVIGYLLQKFSDARMPYLDAFTTVFSLIATWFMVTYVHENWLYWIVIDTVSIYLYMQRGLKLTAILFVVYTFLAINGYLTWI